MEIKKIISRADEYTIQKILGTETIKILNMLSGGSTYNKEFKELLLKLHNPESFLLNKELRDLIIDLLKPEEIITLARILDVYRKENSLNTHYKSVKSIRFRNGTEKQSVLFSFFNLHLPVEKVQEELTHFNTTGGYQLFKHQRDAVRNAELFLRKSPYRVLLHMPTGSGKTRTAMNIVSDFMRLNEPSVVIWFANTEELCNQAIEEFEKAWSYLGNRKVSVYRYWGNSELKLEDIKDGFIVAGLSKIVSRSKGSAGREYMANLADKVSFIVMDEAHQAVAPTYQYILNTLLDFGGEKHFLGLSATPGRTWNDKEADVKLSNFFSKKKVKLEVEGFDNPVDYLTEAGYLAKVNFKPLVYEEGILTVQEKEQILKTGVISNKVLSKLASDEQRTILIINEALRLAEHHQRIILFAPSVESSSMISFILESQGVYSRTVTGETNPALRKEFIDDFKNDDKQTKVLCNYGVLTTGFDAPKTSAAIIGRPTTSLVLYSQMVGRAIRGINAGGNAEAEVVTIIDQDLPGFRSVSEAFENWEDVW